MRIPSVWPDIAFKNAIPSKPTPRQRLLNAALSRRRFIGGAAGAVGGALGASMLRPLRALADDDMTVAPTPTTNAIDLNGTVFHVTFFGTDIMPAVINNFNGFVGVADVQGTGTATNADGTKETLLFDTDMRFMKGVYVGVDGKEHNGTFGFV